MIQRIALQKLRELVSQYPIVTVTGPRQSGKTTLCRYAFPEHRYVSLEELDLRSFASEDPRGFLREYGSQVIIDEFQRVPDLASYLQTWVDDRQIAGDIILTGSQNLQISQTVSQSLAGRTALLTLLPLSLQEAWPQGRDSLNKAIWTGGYPRIFDKGLNAAEAMGYYLATYVERDVRNLTQVHDLQRFSTFLRLCAGRTGNLLNMASLAADAGVSQNTAKNWLGVLEATYIIKRLIPWHSNLGKRLVKTPKLYFLDTGLCAHLLGINSPEHLVGHPLRGNLFETLIVTESWKRCFNQAQPDNLFFYRDAQGHEIDLLEQTYDGLQLTEIKSGATVASDWFNVLLWGQSNLPKVKSMRIVHGGDASRMQKGVQVQGWNL